MSIRTAGRGSDPNYSIGITMLRSGEQCATIVGGVAPGSPGERAHINSGDHLIAIDGQDTHRSSPQEIMRFLHSDKPKTVQLTLESHSSEIYTVRVALEPRTAILARNQLKAVKGVIVPLDTTDREVQHMLNFDGRQIAYRVFPLHYPNVTSLFYPGFEIFVLRDSLTVMVGGIEHGPASQAGVHWGDMIVNVNGISPQGKSPQQIEALFTSPLPALMHLTIDRLGLIKTFRFPLVRASVLLKVNHLRLAGSKIVPAGLKDQDLNCLD